MTIKLLNPVPGGRFRDRFGWRDGRDTPNGFVPPQFHNGQDISADTGTLILASHDGVVVWSGWDQIGGGWGVMLRHVDGWSTLYFHMCERSTDVTIGETVTAGQVVGRVGSSGLATGPHLHHMARDIHGNNIDPFPLYIVPEPKKLVRRHRMFAYAKYQHALGKDKPAWAFIGGPTPLIITSEANARLIKRQNGVEDSVRAVECRNEEEWNKFLAVTTAVSPEA